MTSTTISIEIGEEIDRQLDRIAQETGQDKHDIAREALVEWLEDLEDSRDALDILSRNEPASD